MDTALGPGLAPQKATIIGLFADDDAALLAAERTREAAPSGTHVHVLMGGRPEVTETSVTLDRSDLLRITLFGWATGLVVAVIFAFAKLSWLYSLVGVLTGASMGVLLGIWLSGEVFNRRPVDKDGRFAGLLRGGRALVVVDLEDAFQANKVSTVLHQAGGEVYGERPPTLGQA
jgi:hypothetical protein